LHGPLQKIEIASCYEIGVGVVANQLLTFAKVLPPKTFVARL